MKLKIKQRKSLNPLSKRIGTAGVNFFFFQKCKPLEKKECGGDAGSGTVYKNKNKNKNSSPMIPSIATRISILSHMKMAQSENRRNPYTSLD